MTDQPVDHIGQGDAVGTGGKTQRHAMAQHRAGQCSNVIDARRQAPIQQRPGAARQHQRLCGAWTGPPGHVLAHDIVPRRLRPTAADQSENSLDDGFADRQPPHQGLRRHQFFGGHCLHWARFCRASRRQQHGAFGVEVRVADGDLQQEAIKLRLGQRIGALLLDRVLRRRGHGTGGAADARRR